MNMNTTYLKDMSCHNLDGYSVAIMTQYYTNVGHYGDLTLLDDRISDKMVMLPATSDQTGPGTEGICAQPPTASYHKFWRGSASFEEVAPVHVVDTTYVNGDLVTYGGTTYRRTGGTGKDTTSFTTNRRKWTGSGSWASRTVSMTIDTNMELEERWSVFLLTSSGGAHNWHLPTIATEDVGYYVTVEDVASSFGSNVINLVPPAGVSINGGAGGASFALDRNNGGYMVQNLSTTSWRVSNIANASFTTYPPHVVLPDADYVMTTEDKWKIFTMSTTAARDFTLLDTTTGLLGIRFWVNDSEPSTSGSFPLTLKRGAAGNLINGTAADFVMDVVGGEWVIHLESEGSGATTKWVVRQIWSDGGYELPPAKRVRFNTNANDQTHDIKGPDASSVSYTVKLPAAKPLSGTEFLRVDSSMVMDSVSDVARTPGSATDTTVQVSDGVSKVLKDNDAGITIAATGIDRAGDVLKFQPSGGHIGMSFSIVLSAAGTDLAGATLLPQRYNHVTTVASGAGVKLPPASGDTIVSIENRGANTLKVYPNDDVDNNLGQGVGVAEELAVNESVTYQAINSTTWRKTWVNGNVFKPTSAVDNSLVAFNGTTGGSLKDNAAAITVSSSGFERSGGTLTLQETDGYLGYSFAANVTAAATQTQGAATELTKRYNHITTAAADGDGVKLVATKGPGTVVEIENRTSYIVNLYPSSGGDVGAGVNGAITIEPHVRKEMISTGTITWIQSFADSGDVQFIKTGLVADATGGSPPTMVGTINIVSTVAASHVVIMPPNGKHGTWKIIRNEGLNMLAVEPSGTDDIGKGPGSNVDIAPQTSIRFLCTSTGGTVVWTISQDRFGNSNTVAVGYQANASASNAIAVGLTSTAVGIGSVAMGRQANAASNYSIAIGDVATANGDQDIAIGDASVATTRSVSVGFSTSAVTDATAIGNDATAGRESTACGKAAEASSTNGVAVGVNSRCTGVNSTSVGSACGFDGTQLDTVLLGTYCGRKCETERSVVIGKDAARNTNTQQIDDCVIIGYQAGYEDGDLSNKLIIANSGTATENLIGGTFAAAEENRRIVLNGQIVHGSNAYAAAGSIQAAATPLTTTYSKVTAGTNDLGVKLLQGEVGMKMGVSNRSPYNVKVYPFLGDDLQGQADNVPYDLSAGASAVFVYVNDTFPAWYRF